MSKFQKIEKVTKVVLTHDDTLTKFQAAEIAQHILEKNYWDVTHAVIFANDPYKIAGRTIWG